MLWSTNISTNKKRRKLCQRAWIWRRNRRGFRFRFWRLCGWWIGYRGWFPKFATGLNVDFTTTSGHFFANYMSIFHKTEVQTVILRCWTVLYINWLKSYDKNEKHAKTQKTQKLYIQIGFFTKSQKPKNGNICLLCRNCWTN